MEITKRPFRLGRFVQTPSVAEEVPASSVLNALKRHANNDWGDLSDSDWKQNDEAVKTADIRIFSAYNVKDNTGEQVKIWIITDRCPGHPDYPITTVLLPEDY